MDILLSLVVGGSFWYCRADVSGGHTLREFFGGVVSLQVINIFSFLYHPHVFLVSSPSCMVQTSYYGTG